MINWLILYFAIGFVQDMLIIFDFKATQHNHAFKASAISFVSEMMGWLVFGNILINMGTFSGAITETAQLIALLQITTYCFGGFWGGYLTMKFYNRNK